MDKLAIATMPAVPHVVFGIFNLGIPNIVLWVAVIVVFLVGTRARMPKFMEHGRTVEPSDEEAKHEPR